MPVSPFRRSRADFPTETLLLTAFDGKGWAVLERKPGIYERVPVAWLPKGATVGAALAFVMTPGHKGTTVVSGLSRIG